MTWLFVFIYPVHVQAHTFELWCEHGNQGSIFVVTGSYKVKAGCSEQVRTGTEVSGVSISVFPNDKKNQRVPWWCHTSSLMVNQNVILNLKSR